MPAPTQIRRKLSLGPSKFVLRRGENSFFENSGGGGGLPLLISGAAKQTFRPRFGRTESEEWDLSSSSSDRLGLQEEQGKILSNSSLVLPSSESPTDQPSIPLLALPYFGAEGGLTQSWQPNTKGRRAARFFSSLNTGEAPPVVGWVVVIFAGRPQSNHPSMIHPQFILTTFYDCSISIPLDRWGR